MCLYAGQHIHVQTNMSLAMPAHLQAGQCVCIKQAHFWPPQHICLQVNTSPVMPACPNTGQHICVQVNASQTMPARSQAGRHVLNHVSMSASRPAHSCASKHIPDYIGTSTCRPMLSAYVHYKYIFFHFFCFTDHLLSSSMLCHSPPSLALPCQLHT